MTSSLRNSSNCRFLILTNIVENLQKRFHNGQRDPITLEEIIKEFNLTINSYNKHLLATEDLLSNEKIDVKIIDNVNKFVYKPALDLQVPMKLSLLNLLKSRHEQGKGPITVDDVLDTISTIKAEKIINSLEKSGHVIKVTTKKNNKKNFVLFYTDRNYNLPLNPTFIESWRSISIEGLDEKKIQDYIDKHGHLALKKNIALQTYLQKQSSKRIGRRTCSMKYNGHVAHELKDYSNITNNKK